MPLALSSETFNSEKAGAWFDRLQSLQITRRLGLMAMITIAVAAVGIFSAYILYDISRIMQGGETNYVSATLAVYLDIYNVFVSLLQLIMAFTGERD